MYVHTTFFVQQEANCLDRYESTLVPLCLWQSPTRGVTRVLSNQLCVSEKDLLLRSLPHLLAYYLPHLTAADTSREDLLREAHGRDRVEK